MRSLATNRIAVAQVNEEAQVSTEGVNARYADLDLWPTREAVDAMLKEQCAAAAAVQAEAGAIAAAADQAALRLRDGAGRLFYVGAGTSGRLALLDGVELGPTFDWPADRLVYCLAGGEAALLASVEGAEDDAEAGEAAIGCARPGAADVVIGVAASGRTPYTVAAIRAAARAGALTVGIAGNDATPLLGAAAHPIHLDTGPEVVAGSTRMKAGTAQKIALNTISTAIMIRLGRVHGGLMVDLRPSNAKLSDRAVAIVARISGVDRPRAAAALKQSGGSIKRAALTALGADPARAAALLKGTHGNLREAIARLDTAAQGPD
jgi:N-acetylmuramic acid 6-phosphate etherase